LVAEQGDRVELRCPCFTFRLNRFAGLRAESWANHLTGRTLQLGSGSELEVAIGLPGGELVTPKWQVTRTTTHADARSGRVVFELAAAEPRLSAQVTYEWSAAEPVLRKFVTITNTGDRELNRLLDVRLGTYRTDAKVSCRERGFPLYLDDEFFMALAHPAGLAMGQEGQGELAQHPGAKLAPGREFRCMEAVYGVARPAEARNAFLSHLRRRMRRTVRGHDRPYAIFEPFGARPDGDFNESEAFLLDNLAKVAVGQRDSGCRFDLYSVDFWVDYHGDLKAFDPERFPHGLTRINEELRKLGTSPGLWIDSSWEAWSIGGNPSVQSSLNFDPQQGPATSPWGRASFCRATEPIRSMYIEAFRHHIRENGVRLLKFDNFADVCNNPNHDHLPGLYSTEALDDAVIEFLHALDAECPDVFLMLYWGYRSPWWLLHGDTLFDSGIGIEAASFAPQPAPHARDSVTQRLDQAQRHASDVPALGKDSLGVWLSSWGWNSSIGKEQWQEGFVMDLCRGSLLAQPWSDTEWLSPPEREQMADFIALLKARPDCFVNPRFVLGDPWRDEPYGYCCSNGKRAFLALHNCTWRDVELPLKLDASWGLPAAGRWQLYRWYPDPARLRGQPDTVGRKATIWLRPFEVVLLEVVPPGEPPTLGREFTVAPVPGPFREPTCSVEGALDRPPPPASVEPEGIWIALTPESASSAAGATLTVQEDDSILAGGKNVAYDTYTLPAATTLTGITGFRVEALPDPSLPGNGPGRAVNGNFALAELRVTAAPKAGDAAPVAVGLGNPVAGFSQDSHGGWPIAAALDGSRETGWSIDPEEGLRHAATFEAQSPIGFPGGTRLTFTVQNGMREHNLGRFRLSVTTAKPPFPAPPPAQPSELRIKGEAPACSTPSLLVVTLEMRRSGEPWWVSNVGALFPGVEARVAGEPMACTPVLGTATYPAPWQAWRIALPSSPRPRPFELTIRSKALSSTELTMAAHLLPQ